MPKKLPSLSRHAVTAPSDEQGERMAEARRMPIASIRPNPWQPRQHASRERMDELAADVAARGILEPIIVRPIEGEQAEGAPRYEVIAGERRYRAAMQAGLTEVPVIVRKDMSEEEAREASLVENLLREDLDIEDEARFIKALYEQKGSLRAVGQAIHKSYQYVNRRIKLLENPGALMAYREGLINLDHLIAAPSDNADAGEDFALNDDDDQQNGSTIVDGGYAGDGSTLEEVRFFRTRSAFKPFQKLHLHVRKMHNQAFAGLPPEEKPKLRQTVHDLIAELTRLEEALAADTTSAEEIRLEAHRDGTAGYKVKREDNEDS